MHEVGCARCVCLDSLRRRRQRQRLPRQQAVTGGGRRRKRGVLRCASPASCAKMCLLASIDRRLLLYYSTLVKNTNFSASAKRRSSQSAAWFPSWRVLFQFGTARCHRGCSVAGRGSLWIPYAAAFVTACCWMKTLVFRCSSLIYPPRPVWFLGCLTAVCPAGRVPVRVIGPVECGDVLVPSGERPWESAAL